MSSEHAPTSPPSGLAGVGFGRITRRGDSRGSFRELWRAIDFQGLPPAAGLLGAGTPEPLAFVQANLSTSDAGVLRGLHLHRRQLDHWVVATGRAFVALVDVRPVLEGAASGPRVETRTLGEDETVTIPAGVAHGFLALEALELVYFVTNEYDGSDELGFAWDDPDAAVPWPAIADRPGGRPILSARDAANPPLGELLEHLRA